MTNSHPLYINGQWVTGASSITNINPSDLSDVIGEFDQASTEQTNEAINAAQNGFAQWSKSGLEQRYKVLMAIGDQLIARKDELGELLSREEGKPLGEGKGEVYRSGQFFHYYAAEVLRQIDERADSVRPGVEVDIRREPLGGGGYYQPLEFPHGNGGLENRTRTGVWQCRGVQARQSCTRQRLGFSQNYQPAGSPRRHL